MDVDAVADELYGLAAEDFVTARDARARAARAGGDRPQAAAIKALRKPTHVAWVANQLARQEAAGIQELAALGEQLRRAMARPSGPELRRLHAAQRELVGGLVRRARQIAVEADRPMPDPVVQALTETLQAALADGGAAAALASGRLAQGLTAPASGGFPSWTGSAEAPAARSGEGVAGTPPAPPQLRVAPTGSAPQASRAAPVPSTSTPEPDPGAQRLEQARREVAKAEEAVAEARRALMQATAALERSSARARQAAELVEQLRVELAQATRSRDQAEQQQDAAHSAADRADAAVRQAERQLRSAIGAHRKAEDASDPQA